MLPLGQRDETLGERVRTERRPQKSRLPAPAGAALLVSLLIFVPATGLAAEDSPARGHEPEETPAAVVRDRLDVTDSRLRDRPQELREVAAHVTVLERRAIEASGALTLQELLSTEAGIVDFDVSGHDIGRTVDLRGFTGGGIKVFLDGAPLNDPRNNQLSLEHVPTVAVERVEITRGSTATQAGGGAEAGVINLWTRHGSPLGGQLTLSAGDFGTVDGRLAAWQRTAGADFFATGSWYDTDGHRANSGGTLARLHAAAGWELDERREIRLSLLESRADFGNPGALRPDELARDRSQAPFNQADFSDDRFGQLAINYSGPLGPLASITGNLHARRRDASILSTGRAAPTFGGFLLDSRSELAGTAAQVTGETDDHRLVGGLEWLEGETSAGGFFTPATDPGNPGTAAPGSDNATDRRTLAVYLQETWRPAKGLSLIGGLRWDEETVGYRERLPDPTLTDRRSYAELSARLGATLNPGTRWTLYAAAGEAFLPPTVEELFSFPLFGSNSALEPEDSRSYELGARHAGGGRRLDLALFQIDTDDEIVFDPDSPLGLFGANVNAGATRRRGIEMAYRGTVRPGLRLSGAATWLEAEFRAGAERGNRVPLVPSTRLSAGLEARLGSGFRLRGEGLWVGSQVLDNDGANLEERLDAYFVLDARLSWSPADPPSRNQGLTLFVEVENLLDREYATRGIYAFDFSTLADSVFLTPAPPRRLNAGLEWTF